MHGGKPLKFQQRVKHGDILSPKLFNAAPDCALRKQKGKCQHHGIAMGHCERLTNIRHADDLMLYARSFPALVEMIFFYPSRLFAAIRSQGAVLLVSFQALGLFLYWPVSRCAKSKGKVQTQSPLTNQGGWGGRRLGSAGSGGSCTRRSLRGGGSRLAQRCWSVTCFGSGKVGDEGGGFLTPTASHFDS